MGGMRKYIKHLSESESRPDRTFFSHWNQTHCPKSQVYSSAPAQNATVISDGTRLYSAGIKTVQEQFSFHMLKLFPRRNK